MKPWQWIRALAGLTILGWVARPINAIEAWARRRWR
jgi:hypothetical protein